MRRRGATRQLRRRRGGDGGVGGGLGVVGRRRCGVAKGVKGSRDSGVARIDGALMRLRQWLAARILATRRYGRLRWLARGFLDSLRSYLWGRGRLPWRHAKESLAMLVRVRVGFESDSGRGRREKGRIGLACWAVGKGERRGRLGREREFGPGGRGLVFFYFPFYFLFLYSLFQSNTNLKSNRILKHIFQSIKT